MDDFQTFGTVPDTFASCFPFATMDDRFEAGDDHAWLYRYLDMEGSLLYVGMSKHPAIRDEQHWYNRAEWRRSAVVLKMELFDKRGAASRAELLAIHLENPLGNWQRRPPDTSDAHVTSAPEGSRTIWAEVANYSRRWHMPTVVFPTPTGETA
jgi:hypothetical protein